MKTAAEGNFYALLHSPVNQRGINVTHMQMVYFNCKWVRFVTDSHQSLLKVRFREVLRSLFEPALISTVVDQVCNVKMVLQLEMMGTHFYFISI